MPDWPNTAPWYRLGIIREMMVRGSSEQSQALTALSSHSTIEELLRSRTHAARQDLLRKRAEFEAIIEAIEQGQVDIDGARRIHVAGAELSAARNALTDIVCDLNAYLTRGILPKDLQSGKTE